MVGFRSFVLLALLAAAVTSTTINHKRQSNTGQVVFRSDLKSVEIGQSPMFKNLLCKDISGTSKPDKPLTSNVVTTVPKKGTQGGFEISFVNVAEADVASKGVVESKGIPLNATDGSTQYFNVGTVSNARGKQPITLGTEQTGLGFLYTQGGELKLGSTTPQFDTWLLCPGNNHPQLSWIGVVQGVVSLPSKAEECSPVRLFAVGPTDPMKNANTC
ncbi:MAG: hypothetical protein Q9166_007316 [cf. Caloplaca sp. 2 TL-2023]